ncbi:efflux RND transporter periplasmic adaptor subunit [Phenylobacterium hankyongense]|uniref:efflux RND transporter periplasmic adaptor subunit n=1 Tax=Phenylobacterium hankyongense TaxID=1813876 RepID=UPI001FB35A34|nr:efflux RND transporter periplasmic adaptor subunit [Phenylobacterium hankyongense]
MIGLLVLVAIAAVIWLAVTLVHNSSAGGPGGGRGGPGGRGGRPATTVGVAAASQADIPVTIDGLGTVTPAATVTVSPQVSGTITQILFREGQMVRKGQALAIIDPRPLQMALLQAQGQQARDEAQLTNARLLLQRDQTLLAQDSIARQDVDTQAALVKQLEGTVTTDRAAVGTARLNLGFSRVVAPVSGRVGLRVIDVGNYIGAGSAAGIVVITQINPIDVEFTIPQDEVPRLQAQSAQATLPVTAFDRTKTINLDQGVFSTLDNQVDTTTGTVRAKARFPNAAGRLFPNQFVNVRVNLQNLRGAVVVPVTAVRTGADGDFVWKLNPDKTVTMRKVVRGPGTPTTVSIVQGLQVGERVITEGGDRLTEGARVMLPGDKPMPQGGGRGRGRHRRPGQGGGAGGAGGGVAAGGGDQPAANAPGAAPQAAQGGGGMGGGAPNPAMQAARQAMMQACAADAKTLCAGQQGRELNMCLRTNADKLSAPCKDAMAKMPRRGPAGGGGGGAGPGA